MFNNNASQKNQSSVYQIDFTAVASGKRIASSKRRVRWRFGFANMDALAAGQTGTDCRGEEHDVTIVWSVTSGKKLVLADGKEVHTAKNRNNVFEFSWTMKGNHVLKVVAHAQPPMTAVPGFRQYDFFVDGQSFFTFPKVFRLGLAPNDPRAGGRRRQQQEQDYGASSAGYNNYNNPYGGREAANLNPYVNGNDDGARSVRSYRSANSNNIVSIEAPHNPEEEDAYLRQAIANSLKEAPSPGRPAPSSAPADNLLLDFMSPAAPAAAPVPALPPSTSQYGQDFYGAQPPAAQQPPAFAALPPSTTAAAAPAFAQAPQPPQQQDPWAMAAMVDSLAASLPPSQPPTAPQAAGNPFGLAAPAGYPAQQPPAGGPPTLAVNQDPFGAGPPPTQAGAASTPYGAAPTPFGSPPPSTINAAPKEEFTPATQASSIGFASPMAQPFPTQTEPEEPQEQLQEVQASAPVEAVAPAPPSDPALLSMNVLSGQPQPLVTDAMANGTNGTASGSMADQAYAKLVNMDAFDLVQSKDSDSRKNPFDVAVTTSVSGSTANASLADMQKSKKSSEPKKSIMNAPLAPAPGAMVLSNTQQGNFGGYGGLAGMGQQQQQPTMGGPPPLQNAYGGMQQPYGQQPAYGMQQQQQPMQQPMQQPSYGMQGQYGQPPAYGQQPPPQAYGQQQQQQPPDRKSVV